MDGRLGLLLNCLIDVYEDKQGTNIFINVGRYFMLSFCELAQYIEAILLSTHCPIVCIKLTVKMRGRRTSLQPKEHVMINKRTGYINPIKDTNTSRKKYMAT